MKDDLTSPFTGLFSHWGAIVRRPHDPAVDCWAGVLPRWSDGDLAVGGAAWTVSGAEAAALGEAVERWRVRPSPGEVVESSYTGWQRDEEAIATGRWVLFSREQYQQPNFPFAPLTEDTVCGWTCCREIETGRAVWVPAALVFLQPPLVEQASRLQQGALSGRVAGGTSALRLAGGTPALRQDIDFTPSISTGLSAGRCGDPVLLRGVQELIERDALVGAWWGRYALEEFDPARVWRSLQLNITGRMQRPHLRWRFYRIDTPLSSHVTIVSVSGEDHEGFVFAVGSACRETRVQSWLKSLLEAVQSYHYARYLKVTPLADALRAAPPDSFAGHALYYSIHPDRLLQTPLLSARTGDGEDTGEERLDHLCERLGPSRCPMFRLLTPAGLETLGWIVLRVLAPGLQPLHGHHRHPFLGGPLWSARSLRDYDRIAPHPFP